MTQSTEQERFDTNDALALANALGINAYKIDGYPDCVLLGKLVDFANQAARRAPVVPVPHEADFESQPWGYSVPVDAPATKYYAAAPQPPESGMPNLNCKSIQKRIAAQTEEAPVQLPEPVGCVTSPWGVAWNTSVIDAGSKLYTEQQVLTLLEQSKKQHKN